MKVKKLGIISLEIAVFFLFYQSLAWLVQKLDLPLPANVVGMIILFLLLVTGVIPIHWLEDGATILLKYMPLMFIPYGVAMTKYGALLKEYGLVIIFVLLVTSFSCAIATGFFTQMWLQWRESKKSSKGESVHANAS